MTTTILNGRLHAALWEFVNAGGTEAMLDAMVCETATQLEYINEVMRWLDLLAILGVPARWDRRWLLEFDRAYEAFW